MTSATTFVSYASQDAFHATRLSEFLEQHKVVCWIAPRDIALGQNYGEAIVRAIYHCRCMVVLLSEHSNQSKHVAKEVERAVHADLLLIPVRLDQTLPSGALEYLLSTNQWLDLGSSADPGALMPVVDAIKDRLGDAAPAKPAPPPTVIREQAIEMQELVPDEWNRRGKRWRDRVWDSLFADKAKL
ncbi:MAG: toll/interleukin-1 receptor domain-containing protein [Pseudomonadota bacterium]